MRNWRQIPNWEYSFTRNYHTKHRGRDKRPNHKSGRNLVYRWLKTQEGVEAGIYMVRTMLRIRISLGQNTIVVQVDVAAIEHYAGEYIL